MVFPGNQYKLFIEFDTHHFTENERIPTIKWKEEGKKILLPIETKDGGFSGRYQTLRLQDDGVYK